MRCKCILLLILQVMMCLLKDTKADDFPSLLTANASIAILLDREYLDLKYENTLTEIKVIIEKVLREDLKNGGLYVYYYSWTSINLKKDFTAILSVANCKDTWKVFREARSETLLMLALTDPDCPRLPPKEAIMIPIMSIGEELPQVLIDLKSSGALSWKSAIVLHDDTFARDMISRVVIAVSSDSPDGYFRPTSVSIFKLRAHIQEWERRKSIRRTLSTLPTNFIGRNFVVIVTTTIMENIMEVAKDLDMVDTSSQWLYVVSDTSSKRNNISSVNPLIGEGENIAFAYNVTETSASCVYGIVCHSAELLRSFVLALSKMIREEKAIYGQISDEEWETIRPTKRERRDTLLETMKIHLKQTNKCSNCTNWKIQGVDYWGSAYETTEKRTALNYVEEDWSTIRQQKMKTNILVDVGLWRPNDGVQLTDVLFPHVNYGFRNKNLHVITYHNPPWQIISYNESGVPGVMRGVVIDILNEMSRKLNFTYTMHIIPVNYGKMNDSEEANFNYTEELHLPTTSIPSEIINLVGTNQILLAAVGVTVNERYRKVLNFTIPISIQPYNFIVSRPRELSRLYLFMAPFTTETWLCLGACVVFMAPFLYVANRFSAFYEFKGIDNLHTGLSKMHNCFWYIYGALLQQGGMYLPQADSGRIIIGTWWLVVIVLVTTYCGNLVAFLTFPKIDIPIRTIGQLVKREGTITWSTKSGSFLEEYLRETDEIKYIRLRNGAVFSKDISPEMIERVRQGKHVYIDWKTNLQYIMKNEFLQNDRCDFALGIEDFIDEQIALLLPKNSPYLNLINEEIRRMHQMGFIQRWLKEYLPKRDRCWNVGKIIEVNNHTVNLDDMQGSFMVLIVGCVMGLAIMILECMWFKRAILKEQTIIKPFVK